VNFCALHDPIPGQFTPVPPGVKPEKTGSGKQADVRQMQGVQRDAIVDSDEPLSSKAKAAMVWKGLEDWLRGLGDKPKLGPHQAGAETEASARADRDVEQDESPAVRRVVQST